MVTATQHDVRPVIQLDSSRWPIVVVTPPTVSLSDASIDEFMRRWLQMTRTNRGHYVCIHDLRQSPPMSAAHRKKMTDSMNGLRDEMASQCVGVAMVFDSALMRAMLTAFMWMFRPPYPTFVCPSLDGALAWADQRLGEKAGS